MNGFEGVVQAVSIVAAVVEQDPVLSEAAVTQCGAEVGQAISPLVTDPTHTLILQLPLQTP